MLGTEVLEVLQKHGESFYATGSSIDITNIDQMNEYVRNKEIDVIINCSAYTNVDGAEDEKDICNAVNRFGAFNLAKIADRKGALLIQISTDYVFGRGWYNPIDTYSEKVPLNFYGRSKHLAEMDIQEYCANHIIIRTSWLYGKYGNNFVNKIVELLKTRDVIDVVSDEFGRPTSAKELAEFIYLAMKSDFRGTTHFCNADTTSWYEFARKIRDYFYDEKEKGIRPIGSDKYNSFAERPKYSALNIEDTERIFDIKINRTETALYDYLKTM